MTNIAKIESLLYTVSAELGRNPETAIQGIVSILRARSLQGYDDQVVSMLKEIFLELAMADGVETDFKDFCLYFISRINQEFNILLN